MRGAEAITLQVMNDTIPGAPLQRPGRAAVGSLLRAWRSKRRLSQLDLALDAGISARHLSFIETGRSLPSRATLHAIAERLDVPLRERNAMLVAAGFAPSYSESRLSDDELREVLAATRRVLEAHDPFPGLVLDRCWNVVATNRAAAALGAALPPALAGPPLNVFRASLHPEGLARLTANFAEWAHHLLATLRRGVERSGDERLAALLEEVSAYPNVRALSPDEQRRGAEARAPVVVPCVLDTHAGRMRLFTTLTTFGSARDITLDELCIELFYPADEATRTLLERAGRNTAPSP
jgi:transcriptional regulator with XRE-family HTH domain